MNEMSDYPSVSTDSDFYAPGDSVIISGSGWRPGETITLTIREVPAASDALTFRAVADEEGCFSNSQFSPEQHDRGAVTYWVTATGDSSPYEAQIVFLDCVSSPSVAAQQRSGPPSTIFITDEGEIVGTAVIDGTSLRHF